MSTTFPVDPLSHVEHFAEVLLHWAQHQPEREAFCFLEDGREVATRRSYAELDAAGRRIAAQLLERAEPGDRALLIYAPGLDFVDALVGCLYAGLTAVPAYPPNPGALDTSLPRLLAIAGDAEPRIVLTSEAIRGALEPLVGGDRALTEARWIASDSLGDATFDPVLGDPRAPALLQYTSGSTGVPKGVVVTHANLLANERAITERFAHLGTDLRGVSWLPTYHDMGLMGKLLQTAYIGGSTTLMSPLHFIKRPLSWLEAISRTRATTSGGPNFGYELCLRRIADAELDGLDLSSWRVAFCGAEPIRPATLEAFADRFARCGFDRRALFPCYGLAEATLMVSGAWLEGGAESRSLRVEALERGRVEAAASGTVGSREVMGCGLLPPKHELRIVDPETRAPCPSGHVGEIWVAGPSVAAGYWRKPELSAETFAARLDDGEGPFLRTGDLGFVDDSQLFVTGRRKELMVIRGRNIHPHDLEADLTRCDEAIRRVAAVGVDIEGEEQVGVVVELRSEGLDADRRAAIEARLRSTLARHHGLGLARLAWTGPRSLPKTSSGKLQRGLVRERLLAGAYDEGDALEPTPRSELYDVPSRYFEKIEARNTNYRFDFEADVAWARIGEPGLYFNEEVLGLAGVDSEALATVDGLGECFQWALAIAICEEFVALEKRILGFLREERSAGRLPASRSAELFDVEEVKHVQLFRRYADALKAQRPEQAAELDRHLQASFATAWWHADAVGNYPSPAVYHFVNWLHFVYFEEYSIYLHNAMAEDPRMQPAWISAHAAHMREERQHVVTDAAHLERLILDEDQRVRWSKWFLEQSAKDASGLAGLEGVWTFLNTRFAQLDELPQPGALLAKVDLRKRAFLRLLTREHGFGHTLRAAPGYPAFVRELDEAAAETARSAAEAARAPAEHGDAAERRIREELVTRIGAALDMPRERVDVDQPLMLFGLDSIKAVEIAGELERTLGGSLPPTLLFEHPNIRALAGALAKLRAGAGGPGATACEVEVEDDEDWEPALDESIFADLDASPRRVLITGTTGFLGAHLLAELLRTSEDRAVCLVRARDLEAGRERLRANLQRYQLWRPGDAERIEVVLGDLAQPRLGLSPARFDALAQELDVIFHGGAIVDFVQPYEHLEAVNVGGTQEIIRLAVRGGNLPLNLISTIAIFDTKTQTGERTIAEDEQPERRAGFRNGYGRSKWAAERLVRQAGARGLPIRVFRPGIVSGSTRTGAWQPDMVAAMLKSFTESRRAIQPAPGGRLDAAPVDYVARAMLHIAGKPETLGGVFHLNNPRPTPWLEVYAALAKLGYPVEPTPYSEWLRQLDGPDADAQLRPYLAYFKARDQAWKLRQSSFDCRATTSALADSEIRCPEIGVELLGRYLDHFRRTGFINAQPQPAQDRWQEGPRVR